MKKLFNLYLIVFCFLFFAGFNLASSNVESNSMNTKEYKIKTMTVKYLSGKDTVSAIWRCRKAKVHFLP